jgi:hypothetical protein
LLALSAISGCRALPDQFAYDIVQVVRLAA